MKPLLRSIIIVILCSYFSSNELSAQSISTQSIDSMAIQAMKTFNVPGMAISVIKDGKIFYKKGYGVRSLKDKKNVNENTLFAIASNSKAFTTAALSILVDEHKISFDDKVTQYIPEFKMYDRFVTEEFTIRDLITHRSGLGLGAGDLMVFPSSCNFTKEEIIHNLRYLKPTSSFRSKYDYDNLLYIVAGEVIKRCSGISWEDFIENKIFKPLEMKNSAASYSRLKDTTNIATPYVVVNEKLKATERFKNENGNSAGGIYTNVDELTNWLLMHLNSGTYKDKKIFARTQSKEMWTPQTLQTPNPMPYFRSNFKAYGLGWEIEDINGYKQISHTGGLPGMVSQVLMIPELGFGIIILTNQQNGLAFLAISDMIKDRLLKNGFYNRTEMYDTFQKLSAQQSDQKLAEVTQTIAQNKSNNASLNIIGRYVDPWLGEVTLTEQSGRYMFESHRSPALKGQMYYYKGNTFVVQWDDRSMNADAFVMFNLDENGIPQTFTMKAISSKTDFSFDFQDLSFKKQK